MPLPVKFYFSTILYKEIIVPPVRHVNSKNFKQVREKLNLFERLTQLDWASHN